MPVFRRKNIVSGPEIKRKTDKISKQIHRDARKKIKKGELIDSHGLALYLPTITARFASIKSDVINAATVANYSMLRADKMAETRQLLDFFDQDQEELHTLRQIVVEKAEKAKKIDELKKERMQRIDLTKLKASFEALNRGDG